VGDVAVTATTLLSPNASEAAASTTELSTPPEKATTAGPPTDLNQLSNLRNFSPVFALSFSKISLMFKELTYLSILREALLP
jgi:hypothetical protein